MLSSLFRPLAQGKQVVSIINSATALSGLWFARRVLCRKTKGQETSRISPSRLSPYCVFACLRHLIHRRFVISEGLSRPLPCNNKSELSWKTPSFRKMIVRTHLLLYELPHVSVSAMT
jgi:hypothetical protein